MSQQVGGLLATKPSYHFNRQAADSYRNQGISSDGFTNWHRDHMYKTSYAHFHSKNSVEPKNTAIPGYGGYVPGVIPNNIHAKGFSNIAKESFSCDKITKNLLGLATTGFNLNKDALIDQSKLGSTSKYGKSALQKAHPGWSEGTWRSTTQDFFKNPNEKTNPTFRQTDKWLQTQKPDTKGSGFATNHAYLDGTGWKPDPILKGDNNRSEYRDRFNKHKEFHRDTFVSKERRMPKKVLNYQYN